MKNLLLIFAFFVSFSAIAQEQGQLKSNFNYSFNYEKNYSFRFPVDFVDTDYFEAINHTIGYSKVNDKNKVFTYLLSYTQDNVDYLDLKSITLQAKFGSNIFQWSVFYFNLYIDFNIGYDKLTVLEKDYDYFSFGGGATAELDIKLSEKLVIAPNISHLINIYNVDFYRFYYQSGIALKYNL